MKYPINITNYQAFKEGVRQIPVLDKQQEFDLAQENTDESRHKLVVSHLRFVLHVVQSYRGYMMNMEDLVQEGIVGLVEAVNRFDCSKNVRLASYAVYSIKQRIHTYVMKNFRMAKLVSTKAERRLFYGLRQFVQDNNDYTMEDVAKHFNTTVETVEDMYGRMFQSDIPFEMPVDDEEQSTSPHLTIKSPTVDADILIEKDQTSKRLTDAINTLNPRQKQVIQDRWLTDDKVTLRSLADRYNVSCERARQIELQALQNLRKQMR